MNCTRRIARFERLRHLDELRLEQLAVAARIAANRLRDFQSRHREKQLELENGLAAATEFDPSGQVNLAVWARRMEHHLERLDSRIHEANDAHLTAQEAARRQQNKIKAWEHLLEKLDERERHQAEMRNGKESDEAFVRKLFRQH